MQHIYFKICVFVFWLDLRRYVGRFLGTYRKSILHSIVQKIITKLGSSFFASSFVAVGLYDDDRHFEICHRFDLVDTHDENESLFFSSLGATLCTTRTTRLSTIWLPIKRRKPRGSKQNLHLPSTIFKSEPTNYATPLHCNE